MKNVTIIDIAKALELSPSTVSRALNNRGRMSSTTRRRVLELAKEWGYRPNPHALSLLHRQTWSIGLIVPELTHHFYSKVISGIDRILEPAGYQQLISTSREEYEKEKRAVDTFLNARVDGLLIAMASGTTKYGHIQKILDWEVPLVLLDRMCEDVIAPYVITDDFEGAKSATEYLIGTGCKNILFLKGPENISTTFSRYMGFQEALKIHGIPLKQNRVVSANRQKNLGMELKALLKAEKVDAIFGHSDYHAFYAMKAAVEMGFKVPEDISIMGYADEPVAAYASPAISTVRQPARQMGSAGVEMLLHQIETGRKSDPVVLKTELVIRESTRPA